MPLWEIPSTEDTSPTLPICCHRSHLSRSCCRPGKVLLPSSGPSPASQLIGQVMLETCSVNFSVYRSEPTEPTLRSGWKDLKWKCFQIALQALSMMGKLLTQGCDNVPWTVGEKVSNGPDVRSDVWQPVVNNFQKGWKIVSFWNMTSFYFEAFYVFF